MPVQQVPSELGLNFADVLRIVRRRIWWFVVPAALGIGVALALALLLPAIYEAASVITVEPQSISEKLAVASVIENAERRYSNLQLQILSRENLSKVIDDFKLYADEPMLREEQIKRMRKDITIEVLPPAIVDPRKPVTLESFRVAYRSSRRAIVADVANRLTRDFIGAHIDLQSKMAERANEFIEGGLAKVRTELEKARDQIRDYKQEHQGELPQDLIVNIQRLERLRSELGQMVTQREMSRDSIGRIKSEMESVRNAATTDENDPVMRRDALELALNQHRSLGKTEKHPDIVQLNAELESLNEMIVEREGKDEPPPLSPALASLQRELRGHEVNFKVLTQEQGAVEAQISAVEAKIASTPRHAAELERMEGTAVALDRAIQEQQLKLVSARTGVELVRDFLGEKFEVVENAVPPESPASPNRPLWFVVGAILGVVLGLTLLIGRELTDTTFRSAVELQRAIALPVLATVPKIQAPRAQARRRGRLRRTGVAGLVLLILAGGGYGLYVYLDAQGILPQPTAGGAEQPDV